MSNEAIDNDAEIPYNADPTVLDKMLDELKNTGSEGINIKTLWQNIDESKNLNRSYTLSLAKFLNLVDSDGAKIWLTKLGNQIRFYSGEKRNGMLVEKMPQTYKTMCKWIKHSSGEILVSDLKAKYVEVFGNMKSNIVFDRAIASFLNYCKHIGVLTYFGKGSKAKITLTNFGRQALDQPVGSEQDDGDSKGNGEDTSPNGSEQDDLQLPVDAKYPIIIKTNDRVFEWDVKSPEDWKVIDSVIASIKKGSGIDEPKAKEVDDK